MGDLLSVAGGSGAVTMGVTILINLLKMWHESRKQDAIITRQLTDTHIRAMNAASKRGSAHPITLFMSSVGRFMLLSTALGVLVFLTVYSTQNAGISMYIPDNDPYIFRVFSIPIFELDLGTTWGEFRGIVVFPIWFAIIGASLGYFFGQAPFDRR